MAACGGLEHIFVENPLPESPRLLETLSPWKHRKSMNNVVHSSFTDIFGELHFNENHVHDSPESSSTSSSSSSLSGIDIPKIDENRISSYCKEKNGSSTSSTYCSYGNQEKQYRHSDSFSSMNSESLSLCTEGLGFESFDDVDDLLRNDICNSDWQADQEEIKKTRFVTRNRSPENENHWGESKRSRMNIGEFPPPISCIGRSGKPWVCFKSFRQDGRFILKEIRIPTQELLHAFRENGRLRLKFIQSDDEIFEEEDDESVEENDEDRGKSDDDRNGGEGEGEENNIVQVEISNSNV